MSSRDTLYDLYPGSMTDQQAEEADRHLGVDFFLHPMVDYIPTFGGEVMKEDEERIEALRKLGCVLRPKPKEPDVLIVSKLGRPVFKEIEFIRILTPGDRDKVIERPVEDEDKFRFQKHYEHWLKTKGSESYGTPLDKAPFLNTAQVEEYRFFNVRTVEHLASLSESVIQRFPLGHKHRELAQRFLDAAQEEAPRIAMEDALKERDSLIAEQQAALAEMQARLAKLEDAGVERQGQHKQQRKQE